MAMKAHSVTINDKACKPLQCNMDSCDTKVNHENTLAKLPRTYLKRPKVGKTNVNRILSGSDTRQKVRELRSTNLCMNMSEIASKVGISRQRVYQILREEGLPTKHYLKMTQYACAVCGTISAHKFCSEKCKQQWQQIPVICTRCGKLFTRNRHQFLTNYPHFNNALFCSRDCSSKWWAEHYGFKAYPDHISNKLHVRKHNWDDIWKMHLETGYGSLRLSKRLNISRNTIANILRHYRYPPANDM
jgi:DNA-binding phage protein